MGLCEIRSCPRKSWITQVDSSIKELELQDKVLNVKSIREAIDRMECEEIEVALEHKCKMSLYRELKWGLGPEEDFEHP